jgi:hypothetical protein
LGVTASTPTNLVVGAGDVYVDGSILGASIDNNEFQINRTYYTPTLNGTKGDLIGTTYIQRSEGVLLTSIPEISAAIMAKMWPGSIEKTLGTTVSIEEDATRRIPTADYHDWELRVPRLNGGHFGFQVSDGLNQAALTMTASDSGVVAPRAEVHSHWDANDLTVAPHRIRVDVLGS